MLVTPGPHFHQQDVLTLNSIPTSDQPSHTRCALLLLLLLLLGQHHDCCVPVPLQLQQLLLVLWRRGLECEPAPALRLILTPGGGRAPQQGGTCLAGGGEVAGGGGEEGGGGGATSARGNIVEVVVV
jgi:uncharacterized membrane protein YgcG